jgi:hypothetical protein
MYLFVSKTEETAKASEFSYYVPLRNSYFVLVVKSVLTRTDSEPVQWVLRTTHIYQISFRVRSRISSVMYTQTNEYVNAHARQINWILHWPERSSLVY